MPDAVPGNGFAVSPQRSVQLLAELSRQDGGTVIYERAMKLIPDTDGGWMVMTNIANRNTTQVVAAGGAWSRQLRDRLGIKVPPDSKRGTTPCRSIW